MSQKMWMPNISHPTLLCHSLEHGLTLHASMALSAMGLFRHNPVHLHPSHGLIFPHDNSDTPRITFTHLLAWSSHGTTQKYTPPPPLPDHLHPSLCWDYSDIPLFTYLLAGSSHGTIQKYPSSPISWLDLSMLFHLRTCPQKLIYKCILPP